MNILKRKSKNKPKSNLFFYLIKWLTFETAKIYHP